MCRVSYLAKILIGKDHPGGGFYVRSKNNVRFFVPNCRYDLFNRCRSKCRLATAFYGAGFKYYFLRRDVPCCEDL